MRSRNQVENPEIQSEFKKSSRNIEIQYHYAKLCCVGPLVVEEGVKNGSHNVI